MQQPLFIWLPISDHNTIGSPISDHNTITMQLVKTKNKIIKRTTI